jgi:hypothetical protein
MSTLPLAYGVWLIAYGSNDQGYRPYAECTRLASDLWTSLQNRIFSNLLDE